MVDTFNGMERREYVRLRQPLPASFTLILGKESKVSDLIDSVVRNVSAEGACLIIPSWRKELVSKIKPNRTTIELSISLLDNKDRIKLTGTIVWLRPVKRGESSDFAALAGIYFTSVPSGIRERIRNHIVDQFVVEYQDYRKKG